ncbi:MAG: polysulfide reductase NrfD [Candidatus Riflebacteria bacterium]|nr:polysulfide reductase NrfD [Candidatus Riflebacteria bacterium]
MEGFVFPNEAHVVWSVMIVLYPYITGLVAGAFVISSLYHVFQVTQIRPIARFSLAAAFVFLLFATMPLLIHLGRPDRALNIMITSNLTSAMAGFGYIYSSYLALVVIEIWFAFREDFIQRAKSSSGLVGSICRIILLGDLYSDDRTREVDHKMVRFLAGLGIPMACLLHGYVGFLFGSVKANPWWSTPLMFVIFIFSAIVSGIAVLIFHYMSIAWLNGWKIDQDCVRVLGRLLWGFLIVAVALEFLEVLSLAYQQTEEWEILNHLIMKKLFWTYVVGQYLIFSLVPLLLLGVNALFALEDRFSNALLWVASLMVLVQVLLMRWNVVIGSRGMREARMNTVHLTGLALLVLAGSATGSFAAEPAAIYGRDPAHSSPAPLPPPERGLPPNPAPNPKPDEHYPVAPPPLSEEFFPCTGCHNAKQKANPERRKLGPPHDAIVLKHDEQNRWCLDCHDEKNRDKLHLANGTLIGFDESYRLCGQCHGPTYRDWKLGIHGKRTGMWNGKKEYLLCAHCHYPHSPGFKPLQPEKAPARPEDVR